MPHSKSVQEMWSAYLLSLGENPATADKALRLGTFGDNEQDARDLAALVKAGHKRATASAYWAYEGDQEPLPAVGDWSVIVDSVDRRFDPSGVNDRYDAINRFHRAG
jgi:Uncharacterized protein conserved in bacteria